MSDNGPGKAPIVTFSRAGKKLTLGRQSEDIVHLYGSTGLGLPPVSIATSDRVGGDGAITRGVRYDVRKVFIPLIVYKNTVREATETRRELYRLLAPHLGEVEITIFDPPTGSKRSINGYLIDGLTGDFGNSFYGNWQTFGLEFQCNSPWWTGEQQELLLRLNPGLKPFISDYSPFFPVILNQSTVNGSFTVTVSGDEEIYPVWEITGPGSDLLISNGIESFSIKGDFKAGETVRIDMQTGRMEPDLWGRTTLDSQLFGLKPGNNQLTVTMVNATAESTVRGIYRERFLEAI